MSNYKMKRVLKGLRYISHIFENEKETEMQIGSPTDVKHIAHIGWDGGSLTHNSPTWMNNFKVSGGYSPALLGNIKEDASCISEDSTRSTRDKPGLPKSSRERYGSPTKERSRRGSSRKSKESSDNNPQDGSKRSRRKKSNKDSSNGGSSSRSSRRPRGSQTESISGGSVSGAGSVISIKGRQ